MVEVVGGECWVAGVAEGAEIAKNTREKGMDGEGEATAGSAGDGVGGCQEKEWTEVETSKRRVEKKARSGAS